MAKKKEISIDDLATIVMKEFTAVREEMNAGFSEVGEQIIGLKKDNSGLKEDVSGLKEGVLGLKEDVSGLKKDMVWVKEILESHTKMLKDLDEERIFMVHRTDRIESDVDLVKKRLKIA